MSVLLPTEGNPINPTLATPVLATSNPAMKRQPCALLWVFNPLTAPSTSARGRCQQLSLELGKFCLQLTQMKAGGLVFLRLGHLFLYRFDL